MDRKTLIRLGEKSPYFQHLNMAFEDSGKGWARGKVLMGDGNVRKMGRKTAFVDAEIFDADGNSVAVARCTIMISSSQKKGEV